VGEKKKRSSERVPEWGRRLTTMVEGVQIMVEGVQDQVKLLAEGQTALRAELKEDLRQMEARLVARIEVLEMIVREHSAILKEHTAELRAIRMEMALLATKMQVDALERRVAALEALAV
jgi:hypothetical protein